MVHYTCARDMVAGDSQRKVCCPSIFVLHTAENRRLKIFQYTMINNYFDTGHRINEIVIKTKFIFCSGVHQSRKFV